MNSKNKIILIDDVPITNVAESLRRYYQTITIFKDFNAFFENYEKFKDEISILLVDIQFNNINEEAGFYFLKIFYNLRRILNKYMISEIDENDELIKHYLTEIIRSLNAIKVKSADIIPGFKNVKLPNDLNSKLIAKIIDQNYSNFKNNIDQIITIDNFKIFITSYFDSLRYIKRAEILQAKGYIHKNSSKIEQLPEFIEENINSDFSVLIDDSLLLSQCFKNTDKNLTTLEMLVLKFKASGKTYSDIIEFLKNNSYILKDRDDKNNKKDKDKNDKDKNDKIDKNYLEKMRFKIGEKLGTQTNDFDKIIIEAFKQKVITPEDLDYFDILL